MIRNLVIRNPVMKKVICNSEREIISRRRKNRDMQCNLSVKLTAARPAITESLVFIIFSSDVYSTFKAIYDGALLLMKIK